MQSKSDAQLLREYAERGAESAFTEIVSRHTDLVYSAAVRLDSADVARDVVQSVFSALARSARTLCGKLDEDASLAGWLYRSARNISHNLRREEFRRHSRERQAMQNLEPVQETAIDWDRLRPVLDEAMAGLSNSDHDALVLRYFKNQDYRAVGTALGVSDDAAQKRVARALERLRMEFNRKGITTTAAALAVALSANAVTVAPAGLAASAATAALASAAAGAGGGMTLFNLISMAKLKLALGCGLLAVSLATPLVLQRQSINRLRYQALRASPPPTEVNQSGRTPRGAIELGPSEAQPNELLRLRGEAGVLRRELAEMAASRSASSAADLRLSNSIALIASHGRVPLLNSDQAEAYADKNGRRPECLLAAYFASGDKAFLREAIEKYPNDPRVAFTALSESEAHGAQERRQWLDRFNQAAPNNALPSYLLAYGYLADGQADQGVRELQAAASKRNLDGYSLDFFQNIEQAYLSAGYSQVEADLAALESPRASILPNLRLLGRKLVELADSYRQAGDSSSAQAVLEAGLRLGQQLAQPSRLSLVEYLSGIGISNQILGAMNPQAPAGPDGLTAQQQLDQNSQRLAALQAPQVDAKALLLRMPVQELATYLNQWKANGAVAALQWLETNYGNQASQ